MPSKPLAIGLASDSTPQVPIPFALSVALLVLLYGIMVTTSAANFLRGNQQGDFMYFYHAALAMRHGGEIYSGSTEGYVYPPLLAFLLQPLTFLPLKAALLVWLAITTSIIVTALFLMVITLLERFSIPSRRATVALAMLVATIILFDKLHEELSLGQSDVLSLLALALCLRWMDRLPFFAGTAIGFAANIKYLPLIFLPYFLLRGRWASAAGVAVGFVLCLLIPALTVGWQMDLHYVRQALGGVSLIAHHDASFGSAAHVFDIAWHRSISLTSAFVRAGDALGLQRSWSLAVLLACAVTLTLAIGIFYRTRHLALLRFKTRDARRPYCAVVAVEWASLAMTCVLISPQTTGRHMVLLLPGVALAAVLSVAPQRNIPRLGLWLAATLLMLGLILPTSHSTWQDPWRNIGGPSWCALFLMLMIIRSGLLFATQRRIAAAPTLPALGQRAKPTPPAPPVLEF